MNRYVYFALALVAIAIFVVLPFLAFGAPIPLDDRLEQKIFYYHVPAAWMMFIAVFTSGIASIGYLAKRKEGWDDVASAAATMAVIYGAIVLTTGPIWARPRWGFWWAWDVRLTTSLLLWMIFVAYTLVRRFGGAGSERLAAGLALFGMVDVPLVYFAVNFWQTQHPSNKIARSMPAGMGGPLLLSFLAYLIMYVLILVVRVQLNRAERRLRGAEDLALDLE